MSTQTSRWRWLKRLFFACLFLLVVLLAFAYYKLPPLAESAIRKAIDSGDFVSKGFTVTSVGPTETVLNGIDVAGRGWRLESPQLTATYTWSNIQNSRLSEIVVTRGVLTIDLDEIGQPPAKPKPSANSSIGDTAPETERASSALPFDQLLAQEITVVLKKGDAEQTLEGVTSIADQRWSFDLAERRHRLRGSASLTDGYQVGEATVHSSNGDVLSWLAFFDVDPTTLGDLEVRETDLTVFRERKDTPWNFEAEVKGISMKQGAWGAEVEALNVAGDVRSLSGRGQLNDVTVHLDEETLRMSGRHQLEIDGVDRLTIRTGTRPHVLTIGDHFTAPVLMTLSMDAGNWEAELESMSPDDAGGLETQVFGILIDPLKLKMNTGNDGKIAFSMPMLRAGGVSLEDISGELSTEDLSVRASHKIYYGQGEVYGPVPVTLTGKAQKQSWDLHLQAETLVDRPWQAYWKGLGFSLHGRAEASWQTSSSEIRLVSRLDTAEVRRNESAVVLDQVSIDGTHNLSAQTLDLGLTGRSRERVFTGLLTSSRDESGRRFDYAISKLSLPENTLLGAFASALQEMPMAAFLDGTGEVELPYDGVPEHRLSLKLARGVYRHPERKLAGQGIAGTFAIESFDPFVTVDDQRAIFGRWRMGDLELTDGQFLYKLGPRGAVLIKEAEATGIGGRLAMKSLSSHPGQPDFESVVTFDKIELSELADLIPGFKGKVGGRVTGQVHLRFRDGILSLPRGSLVLDASSPAFLHLNAKEALGAQLSEIAQDPTALEIVESALKDLVVHELEIGFFDPDAQESVARIRLKGRSREEVPIPNTQGKGKAYAPIHLNINVDDPSELVRRLLNFGLRKQLNTRLKPGG